MPTGRTLQVAHYLGVTADCSSRGRVEVRILSEPTSGTIRVAQGPGYSHFTADCSSRGAIEVRIVSGPSSGAIRLIKRMGYTHFTGDYQKCNTQKVAGETAYYTPRRGFTGSDSVQLDVFFPNGIERTVTYQITVK